MLTRNLIKRMSTAERSQFHLGCFTGTAVFGTIGYFQYRDYLRKTFQRSEGHHKFDQIITDCTPWKQMYFTWWRMPEEEYDVYHRFRPYLLTGQVDYNKEILIPKRKVYNGVPTDGYDVINPIYCYEGGKISMRASLHREDPISVERAAIILHRGWIPAAYKDKRSRPHEVNKKELVRVTGTWLRGKDIHDYKIPNNPDSNEWHNLALEDIGLFWDLPNFDEAKYYYFAAVDLGKEDQVNHNGPVQMQSRDEVINNHYGWRWHEDMHKMNTRVFGALSAISFALTFLSL